MKDADKDIIAAMRAAGRLIDHSNYSHSYPFCWRSDTPLIYKVIWGSRHRPLLRGDALS